MDFNSNNLEFDEKELFENNKGIIDILLIDRTTKKILFGELMRIKEKGQQSQII